MNIDSPPTLLWLTLGSWRFTFQPFVSLGLQRSQWFPGKGGPLPEMLCLELCHKEKFKRRVWFSLLVTVMFLCFFYECIWLLLQCFCFPLAWCVIHTFILGVIPRFPCSFGCSLVFKWELLVSGKLIVIVQQFDGRLTVFVCSFSIIIC